MKLTFVTCRLLLLGLPVVVSGCVQDLLIPLPPAPTECNEVGREVLTRAFPRCDPGLCGPDGKGYCVDEKIVGSGQKDRLASCSDGTLCVPERQLVTEGRYTPKTCRSVGNLEGRCLSECVPEISRQGELLPRADCDPGERCAPCYDPTKQEDTGACSGGVKPDAVAENAVAVVVCDAVTEPMPNFCSFDYASNPLVQLDKLAACPKSICPAGGAHCAPTAGIPEDQRARLGDCDASNKCVPDALLVSGSNVAGAVCRAGGGLEGRCQSTCIKEVADQATVLIRSTCAESELCAPCFDPRTKEPTGACTASKCDAAREPLPDFCKLDYDASPLVDVNKLDPCPSSVCPSGGAHCLENSSVDEKDLAKLADCGGNRKCVPDSFIGSGGNASGKTCMAFGGKAEGRCTSECLPDIASQKATLKRETCDAGELCGPCFNPVTGTSTGACEASSCDMPASPAYKFPECCGGKAICVPKSSVATAQQGSLNAGGCAPTGGEDSLCAPRENAIAGAMNETYVAPKCTDDAGLPGACISTCVSNIEGIFVSTKGCPADTRCVPCEIPLNFPLPFGLNLKDLVAPYVTGSCL